MTAADGSRLSVVAPGLWVDLDDVASVFVQRDPREDAEVWISLRHGGNGHTVRIPGTKPRSSRVDDQAKIDDVVHKWLLEHLPGLLEGVDYGATQ